MPATTHNTVSADLLTASLRDRLLLSIRELSQLLSRSEPSLHRDNAAARLPRPIRLNRSLRWLRSDIEEWLRQGCPDRETFEARKKTSR